MSEEDEDLPQSPLTPEDLEKIPADIRPKLEPLLVEQRFEMIRSPLLPPAILTQYNEAVPGLAEKLIEWTEAETSHRHQLERESFEEAKSLRSRAQLAGAIVSLVGLGVAGTVGAYTAIHGSFAGGVVAVTITIASVGGPLAARVMAGRWSNKQDGSDGE